MTSREALDELEWFINCVYDSVEDGHAAYLKDEVESASNAYNKLEKDLDRLEKFEKVFSYLKSMFDIKIGVDSGNEYFIEIKQLDTRIAELIIPQEDKEIFKEVLEDE